MTAPKECEGCRDMASAMFLPTTEVSDAETDAAYDVAYEWLSQLAGHVCGDVVFTVVTFAGDVTRSLPHENAREMVKVCHDNGVEFHIDPMT